MTLTFSQKPLARNSPAGYLGKLTLPTTSPASLDSFAAFRVIGRLHNFLPAPAIRDLGFLLMDAVVLPYQYSLERKLSAVLKMA